MLIESITISDSVVYTKRDYNKLTSGPRKMVYSVLIPVECSPQSILKNDFTTGSKQIN
jgi:hypothetical protein